MTHNQLTGRVGALSRRCAPNDPRLLDARRDLAALQLETYVGRIVAAAPPLTPGQRQRIVALLDHGRRP
ncbi:hypothetical protein [Actinomycetospora soli]|uniref:hypothetical protein n=1 Tax=Actinomycetospora soli TaxID=2893887 RepID=UPI001E3B8F8C|nr:hypothetical protein [Actinomycetospora soli]MCD2191679.1 hypothetical protein [Actinomycetospora soli]